MARARKPKARTAQQRLAEALEQQAATSEILKAIASSPTELQPVFDTIATRATRLCDALYGLVFRFDGEMITPVGHNDAPAELLAAIVSAYPAPPGSTTLAARAIQQRRVIAIADTEQSTEYPQITERARAIGYRSVVSVPMLQGDRVIGVINVVRAQPIAFSETQIELLKTFADQAVIAIENARLLSELQDKNTALTAAYAEVSEALERQTATAAILGVISNSPTDVQRVLDAVVDSAVRLCNAYDARIWRLDGDRLIRAAGTGPLLAGSVDWVPMDPAIPAPAAFIERRTVHFDETQWETDPRVAHSRTHLGIRSGLVTPLMREGQPVGVLGVRSQHPGRFSDKHVDLLRAFADQAVIAIENARLFTELQARNRELTAALDTQTATSDILHVISRSQTDVQPVFDAIVVSAVRLLSAYSGTLTRLAGAQLELAAITSTNSVGDAALRARFPQPLSSGGPHAQAIRDRAPINIADAHTDPRLPEAVHAYARVRGYRSQVAVPMLRHDDAIGTISLTRSEPGGFTDDEIGLLKTFADQAVIAIENARLLSELQARTRELEVASQHKSEFLASMSHELRTPLNAVIGFSDVLLEGMFGDTNEKQTEYLRDIHSSGQHLLSLINDILDLSKIEAGRMELDVTTFDLPVAIDDAILLMRERAGRRGITLDKEVDGRLGEIRADQRKVKQVLLNLLSNAVKFTPEGGRITVRAGLANGASEISVTDTGIGIAPEDQTAVFEEFRQVGKADRKAEGTGLGLALCRKFVELHGGQIWVKSQVDAGSTFTFTIPLT